MHFNPAPFPKLGPQTCGVIHSLTKAVENAVKFCEIDHMGQFGHLTSNYIQYRWGLL